VSMCRARLVRTCVVKPIISVFLIVRIDELLEPAWEARRGAGRKQLLACAKGGALAWPI
jgi:hypothetical protein